MSKRTIQHDEEQPVRMATIPDSTISVSPFQMIQLPNIESGCKQINDHIARINIITHDIEDIKNVPVTIHSKITDSFGITNDTIDYESLDEFLQIAPTGEFTVKSRSNEIVVQGTFTNGNLNGYGVLKDPFSKVSYKGMFKNNTPDGDGILYKESSGTPIKHFKGSFFRGMARGIGIIYDICGTHVVVRGTFRNGQLNGIASIYAKTRLVYSGSIRENAIGNIGKIYKDEKVVYDGGFCGGVPHGKGVIYRQGQVYIDGVFNHGRINGKFTINHDGVKQTLYATTHFQLSTMIS